MGYSSYSTENRTVRSAQLGYQTKAIHEIFTQRSLDIVMNPNGVKIRESRDSDNHPNSVAIILGLDVTGSMGRIPHHLVKEGLPTIMSGIIEAGIPDPQLMFLAIGDHKCDQAPLQVSQFESDDETLDKWLTNVWLEGLGGGNDGESYPLAYYFATFNTSIDCFEKRGQKGFLFTIGDEHAHRDYPGKFLDSMMGYGENKNYTASELLALAKEKYNVYHIHVKEGSNGTDPDIMNGWKELIGKNLLIVEDSRDIPNLIARTVYESVVKKAFISSPIPTAMSPQEPQML